MHSTWYRVYSTVTVHSTDGAGRCRAECRECWLSSVWSQPVPWQQCVTETCNTSWHSPWQRYRVCYMCEHGTGRSIIGVLSAQVTGGSSHPSEASYESGDYLWPSQCLESGSLSPAPAPPQPGTSFTWTLLSPMKRIIRAQGEQNKENIAREKNRVKNSSTYQQRAWPSFRKKQKSDLQENILIRWMMIPVSCLECLTHTFVTASENQIQLFNKKLSQHL